MIHLRSVCKVCSRRCRTNSRVVVSGRTVAVCRGCVRDLRVALLSPDPGTKEQ